MLVLSRFFSVRNGRAAEQSPAKHEAEASIVRARGNEREAVARFFSVPWADQGVPDGLAHKKLDRLDWGGRRGGLFPYFVHAFLRRKRKSCGDRMFVWDTANNRLLMLSYDGVIDSVMSHRIQYWANISGQWRSDKGEQKPAA